MKPITKPIAILARVKPEYSAVIHRLKFMGFKHGNDYSHDRMMLDSDKYCVFDVSGVSSGTYTRNSAADTFADLIPAAQFLAEYGASKTAASEAPTQPETPLNPPNFVVDTDRNETLSRIVQELAFAAGLPWGSGSLDVKHDKLRYIYVTRSPHGDIFDKAGLMLDTSTIYDRAKDLPVYSAATQMGEIVRLLSTPVVPPVPPAPTPPEIHGYKAVYTTGGATVNFGCAGIDLGIIRDASQLMEKVRVGTRQVFGITLSSGKALSREQVTKILAYVAAVEEYAKKYPQKSS